MRLWLKVREAIGALRAATWFVVEWAVLGGAALALLAIGTADAMRR